VPGMAGADTAADSTVDTVVAFVAGTLAVLISAAVVGGDMAASAAATLPVATLLPAATLVAATLVAATLAAATLAVSTLAATANPVRAPLGWRDVERRDILGASGWRQPMRLGSSIVVALSFFLLPLAARAEDPCKIDAENQCKNVPPGGGRIIACLKAHETSLSLPCKEKLAAGEARREMVKEACHPDAEKFCKGIKPGEGRIAACLKAHESELAPACQKLVERVETAIREVHEACGGDVEKLCQGIRPGGGRMLACLKSHEAELSGPCKAVLARKEKPAR